ncbi:replication protein [Pasteurellaceae bacterium 22721_9_1]
MSKFIPNSFQVPNAVIDELMSQMSCAELKCYLAIVRKTKGWGKEEDAISITQLMKVTGLSNRAVINACVSLAERGLVNQKTGERNIKIFSVNLDIDFTREKSSRVTSEKTSLVNKTTSEKTSLVTSEKSSHTKNNIKNNISKKELPNGNSKKTPPKSTALELLNEFGITGQLAEDFIGQRKSKRAVITRTMLERLQIQADLAKLPLQEVVAIMIDRNWQGFKASWEWQSDSPKPQKRGDNMQAEWNTPEAWRDVL